MSAADRFPPGSTWGSWLRQDLDGRFVDQDGRTWGSLVSALVHGRLRFGGFPVNLLVAFLSATGRRPACERELIRDLFDDSRDFMTFFREWCRGQELIDDNYAVTAEGQAALALLTLTRDWTLGPVPVGEHAVSVVADPAADRAERERMFEEAEAFGRKSKFRFERDVIAGRPVVTFSGRHVFRGIPLGAVVWTQDFPDEESRDAFHHWLCLRVDRWGDWGERAARLGKVNFGAHLLSLLGADMAQAGMRRLTG